MVAAEDEEGIAMLMLELVDDEFGVYCRMGLLFCTDEDDAKGKVVLNAFSIENNKVMPCRRLEE